MSENNDLLPVDVSLNDNMPVLYTDFVMVYRDKYGFILDFAHSMGPLKRKNVVTRLGMSREMAKEVIKLLEEQVNMQIKD